MKNSLFLVVFGILMVVCLSSMSACCAFFVLLVDRVIFSPVFVSSMFSFLDAVVGPASSKLGTSDVGYPSSGAVPGFGLDFVFGSFGFRGFLGTGSVMTSAKFLVTSIRGVGISVVVLKSGPVVGKLDRSPGVA